MTDKRNDTSKVQLGEIMGLLDLHTKPHNEELLTKQGPCKVRFITKKPTTAWVMIKEPFSLEDST